MKKQNFLQGALILMAASLIVKVFGAIFKIPLTNIIGVTSMAYFNTAYSFYVIFYMISTAGIPVALSKMISEADAKENKKEVDKIFKVSYTLFFVLGVIGSLIMIIFSKYYSSYVKLNGLEFAILAITPTLFFMCITSAYRGYFQGLKNMAPTAVSQVIGAIGKLFIGLLVAIVAVKFGAKPPLVAAYTILGITVGSIGSTVFLSICKRKSDKQNKSNINVKNAPVSSPKTILKVLIEIAIPITLSATILSLTNTIDATFMIRRLIDIGINNEEATKIMGAYTSMSVPLFNLSPNLIYPLAISVIPTITSMCVAKKTDDAKNVISSSFRIASIIAVPCAFGLSVFSRPIVQLLYNNKETILMPTKSNAVSAISVASEMLSVLSIAIFFVSMVSVTNGILQAYGKEKLTIISTTIGIILKVIFNYILIGNNKIGYYGAPLSTLMCYVVITIINFYFLMKHCEYKPKINEIVFKPAFSATIGIGISTVLYKLLSDKIGNTVATMLSIIVAAALYFIFIFAIKGIKKEDIQMLPKGEKIVKLFIKLKIFE